MVIMKYTINTNINGMSWIWKEIFKLAPICDLGSTMKIANGMHIIF
jgi:hypothetical protein